MAAPIQRYSDPRLYGTAFVKPFNKSYQWTRTIVNPRHPECYVVAEFALQIFKLLTGISAMSLTFIPALVGRILQIFHYHYIGEKDRTSPPMVKIAGIELPRLFSCKKPDKQVYETTQDNTIHILRWGFDPRKIERGEIMSNTIAESEPTKKNTLVVSVNVQEGEFAYIYPEDYNRLRFYIQEHKHTNLSNKEEEFIDRKLFYQNGYRAIKYNLLSERKEIWAICDPSCISITSIQQSS